MSRGPLIIRSYLFLLFAFAVAFLLFPKLVVFQYYSNLLWGNHGIGDLFFVMAQDVLIASLFFGGICWGLSRGKPAWTAFFGTGLYLFLFTLLMLDARARQLWLRPTDIALLKYAAAGLSDLKSGNDLFFKTGAGFGMTFRRLLFFSGVACSGMLGVFLAFGFLQLRNTANRAVFQSLSRRFALRVVAPCCAVSFLASVCVPRYDYALQQNFLVGPLVSAVRNAAGLDTPPDLHLGEHFEQKAVPVSESLGKSPRSLLKDAPPFSNLILIAFESLRWKGMGFDTREFTATPFLGELAANGLLAKCYTTLPHSCKSEYSMITGRHPYPSIEIREAYTHRHESLFWELRKRGVANTYCFSGLFLGFESLGGILRACGIDNRLQNQQLMKPGTHAEVESSFGGDDIALVEGPTGILKTPYAAFYLPFGAHYEYLYPGKPAEQGADFDAYVQAAKYSDSILRAMFRELAAKGLLDNTLVVLLGDHGESFGEHGSMTHNNSMYEEEITVPLLLWSADGRMKEGSTPVCSGVDITPTILDLFGAQDSSLPVQGESILRQSGNRPIYVSSFFEDVSKALILDNRKYMYLPSSKKLLRFDLAQDPDEKHPANLSAEQTPETSDILARFEAFDAYQRGQFPAAWQ